MKKIRLSFLTALFTVTTSLALHANAEDTVWDKIQERGVLDVAVYNQLPPFSNREKGRAAGVDVDIAKALAKSLNLSASIRMVGADESMGDDLRNNVWKGHYLGGGVADLMLHVPYDPLFGMANDMVKLVAPYYREQIALAVNPEFGQKEAALEIFTHEKIGVELDTMADFYLLSAYQGKIRPNVVHFRSITEATQALLNKEIVGVLAPRSELEKGMGERAADFRIGPIALSGLLQSGWDLGAAVKHNNKQLAAVIEDAMSKLRESGELAKIFQQHGITYQVPSRFKLVSN